MQNIAFQDTFPKKKTFLSFLSLIFLIVCYSNSHLSIVIVRHHRKIQSLLLFNKFHNFKNKKNFFSTFLSFKMGSELPFLSLTQLNAMSIERSCFFILCSITSFRANCLKEVPFISQFQNFFMALKGCLVDMKMNIKNPKRRKKTNKRTKYKLQVFLSSVDQEWNLQFQLTAHYGLVFIKSWKFPL